LTIAEVKGKGEIGTRAGTHALSLLAQPLNVAVIQALAEQPRSLIDLRRAAGSPPQTTMRGHLRALTELGVLERRRRNDFPGALDFDLTACGRELLGVADVLTTWLATAPAGPLQLGDRAAKSAIKALVEGWSTTIVRALAARPLALTQLASIISEVSYPSLERRLTAMRLVGQLETTAGSSRGRPYVVTRWLRGAVAPIAAAARWERLHSLAAALPLTRLDTEATFLLAVPLLRPATELSGSCRLAVEVPNGNGGRLAGAVVSVEAGRVASCTTNLQGHADAWVSGSAPAWFRAVIDHDTAPLEIGGDSALGIEVVDGLHLALFGPGARAGRSAAP
jgi:DNA-binding HxlR family transcriptional regulator